MKIFNKSLKEYFNFVKWYMLVIFVLSVVQIILTRSSYSVYSKNITLIGLLGVITAFIAGFTNVLKNNFKLRHNFIAAILLFIFELIAIVFVANSVFLKATLTVKILGYASLIVTNFAIFAIASLFGGISAILYKKSK